MLSAHFKAKITAAALRGSLRQLSFLVIVNIEELNCHLKYQIVKLLKSIPFLPRDACDVHGAMHVARIAATVSRPYIRPFVCNVEVPWSYKLITLKITTRIISLGSSLLGAPTSAI